jgi:Domain of unknown function (DUF4461)
MSVHRTTYFSKLRRAFLLRVHPDRFRHHNNSNIMTVESIQLQQASLVKALTDRMNQPDVTAWLQQNDVTKVNRRIDSNKNNTYQYFIEKRDGSLLQTTLSLNRSVEDILKSMANALQKSGAAASIPTPPPQLHEAQIGRTSKIANGWDDTTNDVAETATASMTFNATTNTGNIDTRYDIRSNRRRDLKSFLQQKGQPDQLPTTLQDQIRDLRNARMDAISVALQVRRTFQFAAIDATETGWSSASATVLFRRLLTFHEEYAKRLHVTSFYPMRLIFSPRDIPDDHESSIDVYGGIIRLNPASTSIQWLETLRYVTSDTIQQIHQHRATALQNTKIIQRLLNVKISKGFTCSSQDYHEFLERLANDVNETSEANAHVVNGNDNHQLQVSSSSLTVEPLLAVVEADTICRRAVVTSAGIIRLGAGMSKDDCIYSIHRFSSSARDQARVEKANIKHCNDIISNLKWQLGLQKVYRTGGVVSHTEFIDSLTRFSVLLSQRQQQFLFQPFTGNSLGIAPTGQSCQLADDGSVVIPHDWTYA